MSLDNFQRKENTDSSLNTAKEAIKETQNSLNSLDKEILIPAIEWALERNILLSKEKGKGKEIAEYLLNGDYGSRKNSEIERILDQISSDYILYPIISGYVKQTDKQRPQPTQAPSTNSEKSDNWLVNKMVSGANKMVSGARETVSTMVSGATETFSTIVSRAKEFLESMAKLVDINGVPDAQIPILKSMIKKGHEVFNRIYEFWWKWLNNAIDCSGLVSLLLRAGGAFGPKEGYWSGALYQKFIKNPVTRTQDVIAGDLMFWKEKGTIKHVEMVVWKPYRNKEIGRWCVKTLWSSSDTTRESPMYKIDGSAYSKKDGKDGVAYRERVINNERQFLRPQYEKLVAENQKKETSLQKTKKRKK